MRFEFFLSATTVEETVWTCKRDAGTQTQERTRTTTTENTSGGISATIARVKSQVTGFNLNGGVYEETVDEDTDGPAIGACPTNWSVIDGPTTEIVSEESAKQLTMTDTRSGESHTVDVD